MQHHDPPSRHRDLDAPGDAFGCLGPQFPQRPVQMARMWCMQGLRPLQRDKFQKAQEPRPQTIGKLPDLAIDPRVECLHHLSHLRYIPYPL